MPPEQEIGARIRALREAADLKAQALAKLVDLDPSAISLIEHGKRAIKTSELAKIAEALNVSPLAILEPGSLLGRLPVAPRAPSGAVLNGPGYRQLVAFAELHEVLAQGGIPAQPELRDVPNVTGLGWKQGADRLASWARQHLTRSDRSPDRFAELCGAIQDLGIDVAIANSSDELFGASITDPSFPLIYVNGSQPRTRALFTLAHELGHVLASDGSCVLDPDLVAHNDRERLANAFAAALLMPEEKVREVVQSKGRGTASLAQMIVQFGVSFESLVYRLHNLRLVNAAGRDRLREAGWAGILQALGEDQAALASQINAIRWTPVDANPPIWLCARLWIGYKRGVVSIQPLAGLLETDPDQLIRQVDDVFRETTDLSGDGETDDVAFAGSPVEDWVPEQAVGRS